VSSRRDSARRSSAIDRIAAVYQRTHAAADVQNPRTDRLS
jgi:hypothetical protein